VALTLTSRQSGEVTVIGLSGRLDLGSGSVALHEMLHDVTADGTRKILLNLREVSFIDSSGLGELASGHVRAKHNGGALKLSCLSRRIEQAFQMTGLNGILDIYEDEPDAIGSWGGSTIRSV
jgi:anti-sigma B factor antagonist